MHLKQLGSFFFYGALIDSDVRGLLLGEEFGYLKLSQHGYRILSHAGPSGLVIRLYGKSQAPGQMAFLLAGCLGHRA